jgi:DNA-binding HxlR family transcriptional regulator
LKEKEQKNLTKLNVLEAIIFGRDLFNSIATDTDHDDTPADRLKISRKRYYTRLTKLVKSGLIKRKNGRYVLTLFGKVIYGVLLGFGNVVDDHLKLTAGKTTIST